MNDGQFALLQVVCVNRCGVNMRHVHVVMMIGSWSAGSVSTVRHVVFCSNVGEQKVMSGVGEDVSVLFCVFCLRVNFINDNEILKAHR